MISIVASPLDSLTLAILTYQGGRTRRGASGALYPQSAIAELNSSLRLGYRSHLAGRDIEGWVPRDVDLRTPPDPEGSNGKQDPTCAAGVPGPSHNP